MSEVRESLWHDGTLLNDLKIPLPGSTLVLPFDSRLVVTAMITSGEILGTPGAFTLTEPDVVIEYHIAIVTKRITILKSEPTT